jgi:hypothetical protein
MAVKGSTAMIARSGDAAVGIGRSLDGSDQGRGIA